MTDVHGEPQQGGYLPAEIWHAYMAAVTEGQPCTEFPEPKEAISYQPFYGHYATTGEAEAIKGNESSGAAPSRKHSHGHGAGNPEHGAPESNSPSHHENATPQPGKAPREAPSPPADGQPTVNKTGGAAPG